MKKEDLRIVFMGTPEFAVGTLAKLVENNYNVVAVVTQPDKPVGRHAVLTAPAVKKYALEHNIPVLQPEKMKNPEFVEELASYKADLQVVVAFRMLPEVVWAMPRFGTFNVHAALLPQYRGAAPINWAIINGETKTGVTTFFLDHDIDTGRIILQREFPIPDEADVEYVYDGLMQLGAEIAVDTIDKVLQGDGKVDSIPQPSTLNLNPAPKLFKENTVIDFNQPQKKIYDFIRGLSPVPCAWAETELGVMKIFKTRKTEDSCETAVPGSLKHDRKHLYVATQDNWLEILDLQLSGKKRMLASAFVNGLKVLLCLLCMSFGSITSAQTLKKTTYQYPDNEPAPCFPVPSDRQVKWNQTEFYAFFHYGMNTFTGREWGEGNEDESTYDPLEKPDPEQWLTAVKAAHMKGGIAVVKHHDGFCLWDTKSTDHCIRNSKGRYAKTDIPQLFADAARKHGMKYGFYVSPWDESSRFYGTDKYVTDVFMVQCKELATRYGNDQYEMWFDGANGGNAYYGGKEKRNVTVDKDTYYDVPNLRDSLHKVCPDMVMWGVGGEARWIGNEKGFAGETNWAMGSRESGDINQWKWDAGESDAKINGRAGWFWNPASDDNLYTPERLFQMYLETVGRNATLILNCPPDKTGHLTQKTVSTLKSLGELLDHRLGNDLALDAKITVNNTRHGGKNRTYVAKNMTDGDWDTYWAAEDGKTSGLVINLSWPTTQQVRYVQLMENIRLGQRIKGFKVETSEDGSNWTQRGGSIATTTVGYKRILPLNGSTEDSYPAAGYPAKFMRITITDSRACPTLSNISVY